jgi:hypothetical protein
MQKLNKEKNHISSSKIDIATFKAKELDVN